MKKIILLSILFLANEFFAQDLHKKMSFSIEYGKAQYHFQNFNEHYITNYLGVEKGWYSTPINSGHSLGSSLLFSPHPSFDIGVYGNYQLGGAKTGGFIFEGDDDGNEYRIHYGIFALKTESFGTGISTALNINELLGFQKSETTLNRVRFGIGMNLGVGFSKATEEMNYPTYPLDEIQHYHFNQHKSVDFQGLFKVFVEYDFTQKPLFTSLGFFVGYQYYKTKTLKGLEGNELIIDENPIYLNFSGISGGVYLKFGR